MFETSIFTQNNSLRKISSGLALTLFACIGLVACGGGSSSGSNTPPVSETPPNAAPIFQSATAFTVDENQTSAFAASATDAENAALTYSLSGDDAAEFSIDGASGVVTFAEAPDFESPADQGGDNVYTLMISAADGTNTTNQTVTITITDIQEAPVFSSQTTIMAEEQRTTAFTAMAVDPEGAAITYSLSGTDAALFNIDGASGAVTFAEAPDFEVPSDMNGDNAYDLTLSASDGTDTATQDISITVTDFPEARVIELGSLSTSDHLEIRDPVFEGNDARFFSYQIGSTVSASGDINGDGFNDLIMGASAESLVVQVPLETAPDVLVDEVSVGVRGSVYVIFGTNLELDLEPNFTGGEDFNPESLTESQGFIIRGENAFDRLGSSVSFAGDINDDGFDDFIFVASGALESYVIFGTDQGFGNVVDGRRIIDLSTLSPAQGFIIRSDQTLDETSRMSSVSSAGDMNNDGFDDIIISQTNSSTYIIFGTNQEFGDDVGGRQIIDTTTLSAAQGFIIQGASNSIAPAKDVNGDEFADIIIANSGNAYVIFGSGQGFGTNISGRQIIDLDDIDSAEGFMILSELLSPIVSSAGDINGDSLADVIIGAPFNRNRDGQAHVIFGSRQAFGTNVEGRQVIEIMNLRPNEGFTILGDGSGAPLCTGATQTCLSTSNISGDLAGSSVSFAGDVNNDGFDDIMVGAPGGDDGEPNAGEVYLLFGTDQGFGSTDEDERSVLNLRHLRLSEGMIIEGSNFIQGIGRSLSLGDFDGDGVNDFIIGEGIFHRGPDISGGVNVVFGSALQ